MIVRAIVVAIAAVASLWQPVKAAGRVVSVPLADGRSLAGLLMEASTRPAPAVVLVPMLGRHPDDWQAVAQRLADANIHALAIDLPSTALPADAAALTAWHDGVKSAVAFLAHRPEDVRAGSIGIAGASLGASLAVMAAAADPGVRALALVSPSLEYRGLRIEAPLAAYGARPALLMASLQDPYAARSVRTLARDDSGLRQVQWSTIPAHGTLLLARDAALVDILVDWFQRMLG
jgi:dienelactone hydrolase